MKLGVRRGLNAGCSAHQKHTDVDRPAAPHAPLFYRAGVEKVKLNLGWAGDFDRIHECHAFDSKYTTGATGKILTLHSFVSMSFNKSSKRDASARWVNNSKYTACDSDIIGLNYVLNGSTQILKAVNLISLNIF